MIEKALRIFTQHIGEGVKYADVPLEVQEKYKGEFMSEKDEVDIIIEIWKRHGLRTYKNGLISFVNPDEFTEIARKFSDISNTAIVFARTGIGGLFLWDRMGIGDSILYLNVHKNERSIVSTSFEILLKWDWPSTSFWEKDCYGKIELKAIEKYGTIGYDECLTFVPALALGGNESVSKMEKVKMKENLFFLAHLHSEE